MNQIIVKRFNLPSFLHYINEGPLYVRYGIALLTVALAAIGTRYIPVIGQKAAFLLFFFAIIQSAFWLGRDPGILATILSFIAVNSLVLRTTWNSAPQDALTLNIGFCLLAIIFISTINLYWKLTQALLESRQDLDHAQAIGKTGSWRMNIQNNELRWSDENHHIFGIPKGQSLTYETFLSIIHPDDREYVDRKWQATLNGEPYDIEHRIIVDGNVKWVRETAVLEFDKNGDLLGGFGTTSDITEQKQNQLALLQSQQRYVGIIDSTMDAVITTDEKHAIIVFNAAAEKMFGYSAQEIIGDTLARIIPERFRNQHTENVDLFNRSGVTSRKMGALGIISGLRKNGEEFPIEVSISQISTDGEKFFTAILRDITERIKAEQALNEQIKLQNQLAKVAESVPGLICSFRLRPNGTSSMPYASAMFKSIYGINVEEVSEDFSPVFARIHPQDIPHIQETIAESARTLQPWRDTFRYRHPFKGEIWIEGHSIPQPETDGSILWHGYIQDVTARKESETALLEQENELRLITDATPALISYLDLEFRYKRVNKTYRDWFGFPVEDILGKQVQDIIGYDAWKLVRPYLERAKSGEHVNFDYQIPYGTRKPRWVHCNYIPNMDSDGHVKGIVVHVVDIDERIRTEEKITQLNKNLQRRVNELQVIFETVPVGLVIADDASGHRIHGNGLNAQMLGLPPGSDLSKSGPFPAQYKVISEGRELEPKDLPIQRAVRGEPVTNQILDIHRNDGRIVTLLSTAVPLFNEDGTPRGAVGAFQDITELKQTEAALRNSEEQIRLATEQHLRQLQAHQLELETQNIQLQKTTGALETSRTHFMELYDFAPVAYLTINATGLIEEINLTGAELLGGARESLVHRRFADFVSDEHLDRWRSYFEEIRQQTIELTLHGKEGAKLYVQVNCEEKKSNNLPFQLHISLTDITERTLATVALSKSEERMRLATETTGVGIWEWDVATNRVHWDSQMFKMYGVTPTEDGFVHYDTWQAAVVPEDLQHQERILHETLRLAGHSTREFRIKRVNDLEVRYIQAVELARKNDAGRVEQLIGTNLDITERTLIGQALQTSEARLALGVQVAKLAITEVDYHTERIHLSNDAARLFGLGETEMTVPRSVVHATFHPDDRENLMLLIDEALNPQGEGLLGADHRVVWPNGQIRWLKARKQVFFTGEGESKRAVRATLAVHDITTEKLALEAVKASETFVRNILNSLPEHVVVLDKQGTVTAVNEPWERFALENNGSVSNVSVGVNYLDVCRRSYEAGDNDAKKVLDALEAVLTGNRDEFVMEYPCPSPSRNLWYLMHVKRVNHKTIGAIITHTDITEHRQTEAALRESEVRLALIVEEVKAGYWDWDLISNNIYFSPEWKRQIGFEPDEFNNRHEEWENRLHPDDHKMVLNEIENFKAGRQTNFEIQFRLRHKDGAYRWIHSRGALLRNEDSNPVRMLGINLDISEYKKNQELNSQRDEMEKSFRLYVASQTAAAIAHELNQPLTAISYYSYVAQDILNSGNLNPKKLSSVLEKCGEQAQRAGEVIQQLLALLHKGESLAEPIDMNKSIMYAFELVKANSNLNSFKIELNLADNLPLVTANPMQVQKVLIILLNNSLESMTESERTEGIITVSSYPSTKFSSMVQVTVCDCGTGVPDLETLKKIFQPFYTSKTKGLGMGLAISRALIEAHGGRMWAEQNPISGISVHFTLPFVK